MFTPGYSSEFPDYGARQDASQARADARDAQTKVESLERDVDRLLALTEALWLFIKTHHDYTDKDLAKVLLEIEERDKQAPRNQPAKCLECGRANSSRQTVCMYCGKPLPMDPFAR